MQLAGEEQRRDFYAVNSRFRSYSPQELSALWLQGDRYRAQQWAEQWIASLPGERVHSGPSAIRLTSA